MNESVQVRGLNVHFPTGLLKSAIYDKWKTCLSLQFPTGLLGKIMEANLCLLWICLSLLMALCAAQTIYSDEVCVYGDVQTSYDR